MRIILSFLTFLSIASFAQTTVPAGNVSGIWTAANSPYTVQGLVVVQDGQTLQIEPGTYIEFASAGKLRIKGNVVASGTAANPITMTASNTTFGWGPILMDSVNVNSDSTIFKYCTIEYGKVAGLIRIANFDKVRVESCTLQYGKANVAGAAYLYYSDAIFKNNLIRYNEADYQGGAFYIRGGTTLIAGNSITDNDGSSDGGAIFVIDYGEPVIKNNYIANNVASSAGAVSLRNWCDATLIGNTFEGNVAYYDGGVLWAHTADPVIKDNVFLNNSAADEGGALRFVHDCEPIVEGNLFDGNTAQTAGAIEVNDESNAILRNNVFINNHANGSAGALEVTSDSYADVSNCIFSNNTANSSGGALYVYANSNPRFTNCTVTNNRAANGGGFFAYLNVDATFTNCTFANNTATNRGGCIYINWSTSPVFTNCIIRGNTATDTGQVMYCQYYSNNPCYPSFVHSNVEGGQSGFVLNANGLGPYTNNIDLDPLFIAPSAGAGELFDGINADWQISSLSPCFNAGTPDTTGLYLPAFDLAGANRVILDTVDMGAYEIVLSATVLAQSTGAGICEGDTTVLTLNAGGVQPISFQWQFNNVNIPGATNDSLIVAGQPMNNGSFRCVVTNGYASDTTSPMAVTVNALPVLSSLGADFDMCSGEDTVLEASDGPYSYDWVNGSNADSLVISTAGLYFYSVTDTNGCHAFSDTIDVGINALPVFDLGADIEQCGNDTVWLYSGIQNADYNWNNLFVSDSLAVDTSGIFTLTVTDTNTCSFSDTINILMHSLPALSLSGQDTLCDGDSVILYAGGGFASYNWNNGVSANDSLTVTATGSYFVTVTDTNSCSASDTTFFLFNTLPVVDIGPDLALCQGDSATLEANPGMAVYDWNNGLSNSPSLTVGSDGSWFVTVTDSNGCSGNDSMALTINPLPILTLDPDTTICVYIDSLVLNALPAGGLFSGTGVTGSSFDPSLSGTGMFQVLYTYTDGNGCQNADSMNITVSACLGVDETSALKFSVYPNPAIDLVNVLTETVGNLVVYNIRGQVVLTQQLTKGTTVVDISGLDSGLYTLLFTTDSGSFSASQLVRD